MVSSSHHHTSGNSVSAPPRQPLLLRGGEVAELLGISRALAFRWMQRGILPTVRIPDGGKTVRVPLAALQEWIKRNTDKSLPAGSVKGERRGA